MKRREVASTPLNLMLVLNRFTLGMMFALAGLHKIFQTGLGDFYNFFESAKPEQVPMLYGYLLPFVEIIAGLALVAGFFARTASTLVALMLLSFLIGLGISFWPDKGAIPGTLFDSPAAPFDSNVILFTLALWLTVAGPGTWSVDASMRRRREVARSQADVPPVSPRPTVADDRDRATMPESKPVVDVGAPIESQTTDKPSDRPTDPV